MSRIKPRVARVVIYQGDDLAKLAELDAAVAKAERRLLDANAEHDAAKRAIERQAVALLSDDVDSRFGAAVEDQATAREVRATAQAERDEFAAAAEESGVVVHLIARDRKRWRDLMREHGPRDDNDNDAVFGVNMDTLPDILLPESVDREFSTIEGDTIEFLDSLSDYDYYDRLFVTVFALNRGSASADPTQRLLSGSSQTSAAISS